LSRAACRALTILALLALPGIACSDPQAPPAGHEPELPVEQSTAEAHDTVETVIVELELIGPEGAAQRTFARRAPIRLHLTLRNPSPSEVALSFSSGRTHDAVVLGPDGREIWRWSNGRQFTQALSSIELAPGAESHFELVCDPGDTGGPALPPGPYTARGVIPAHGDELLTVPIGFEIE
jgi:hypothetical protein